MPRIILESLSWCRKMIRHPVFSQQCRTLAKINWDKDVAPELRAPTAELFAILEARSDAFFVFAPKLLRVECFLRMAAYREHWIRQPSDWQPAPGADAAAQVFSLIDHLFVTYPMPAFFRKAWMQPGPLRSPARDWFCQIAAGQNIRAMKDLPTKLTGRAAHHTVAAPKHLTIEQALRHGQVLAFGGSEELACHVVQSRVGGQFHPERIWLKLIEKLAREPSFWAHEAPIVIDYIQFKLIENGARPVERLLKGHHIIELAKKARLFWKQAAERAARATWEPQLREFGHQHIRNSLLRMITRRWEPMENVRPATIRNRAGESWQITELCSEMDLHREGSYMHHCVAIYSPECQRGECSIWTLTDAADNQLATIRVCPKIPMLEEARARFNHQPDDEVLSAIHTWAQQNNINDRWLAHEFGFADDTLLELVG